MLSKLSILSLGLLTQPSDPVIITLYLVFISNLVTFILPCLVPLFLKAALISANMVKILGVLFWLPGSFKWKGNSVRHLNSKEWTPASGFSETMIDQAEKFLCMGILCWGKGGILAPNTETPLQVNIAFHVLHNLLLSAPLFITHLEWPNDW